MWKSKAKQWAITALVGAAVLGTFIGLPDVRIEWPQALWAAEITQAESTPWTTRSPSAGAVPEIDIANLNRAFTTLAKTMSPSVVNIYTKTGLNDPYNRNFDFFFDHPLRPRGPRQAQALGSGFVINKEGYIVTNAHVVRMAGRNADEIMVQFIGETTENGHQARIIGVDEATDVALLKLTERVENLIPAPLGNSERLEVGEWVVAIGNPYGHTHTFTQGVVSAVGRSLEGLRTEFIQTSASINPGNSGGPLINLAGEVIAINTAIDPRAQGIGFAIPINSAKDIISQLMTSGRVVRGWLGVRVQDLPEGDSLEGVMIHQIVPEAPADRAGLRPRDIIMKVNGEKIRSAKALSKAVEKVGIGQVASIQIQRDGRVRDLKVEINSPDDRRL